MRVVIDTGVLVSAAIRGSDAHLKTAALLRQIPGMVRDHRELLERAWNEHFN